MTTGIWHAINSNPFLWAIDWLDEPSGPHCHLYYLWGERKVFDPQKVWACNRDLCSGGDF